MEELAVIGVFRLAQQTVYLEGGGRREANEQAKYKRHGAPFSWNASSGDYAGLEAVSRGRRLTAEQLREAWEEYGGDLRPPRRTPTENGLNCVRDYIFWPMPDFQRLDTIGISRRGGGPGLSGLRSSTSVQCL